MEKKWTEEQVDLLLEIYQREGHYDLTATFQNDEKMKKEFFEQVDMEQYANMYDLAGRKVETAMTEKERLAALGEREQLSKILYETAKLRLFEGGIDVEKAYGKDLTPAEKVAMVRERMLEFGIPLAEIEKVNEKNVEEYINQDKDFEFQLEDSQAARNFCEREHIDYEVKNGKIYMQGSLHLQKCLALPDTEEVRRMLKENGIQYIDTKYAAMAQGKRGKFLQENPINMLAIPAAWIANQGINAKNGLVNSQYRNRILSYGALAASLALPVAPHVVVLAWLLMRKMGWLKKNREGSMPHRNLYEYIASRKGNTIYKEVSAGGRKEGYYITHVNGNTVRIPARDVKIPMNINGVNLSYVEREKFRKGELVVLKNAKGEEFGVRIDISNPKLYSMYGKEMRSDKTMMPVPGPKSPDEEKLEYISRKGFQGIRDIYGESRINIERDTFLEKHGLKQQFWMGQNAEERLNVAVNDTQRQQAQQELQKVGESLKEIANNLVLSQHGRRI